MTQLVLKLEALAKLVFLIRGEKIMLDTDLAMLYGVETGALNRAVKRNAERFPSDFMFHGVAMFSSVLRSQRAVEVNIAIMRTFVQLRRLMDSNQDLARRIDSLEARYDEQFSAVFDAIKQLITDDKQRKGKRPIGFL